MRRVLLLTFFLAAISAAEAWAQSESAPADLQYTMLAKVLTFDRNFSRSGREFVVGVVYQEGFPLSRNVRRDIERAFRESPIKAIQSVPVRLVAIPLGDPASLADSLRAHGVTAVYVAPLRAVSFKEVLHAIRGAATQTLTGTPEYVGEGVSLGIGQRDGKPIILINLPAARVEGADFHSNLLRLAEVIR
jgi:hypothetical protein